MADTDKSTSRPAEDVDPREEMQKSSVAPSEVDQAPEPRDEEEKTDVIDTITPKAKPKSWTLQQKSKNDDDTIEIVEEETYVQRPMSFLAKMKFFALLGEVIDKSISGDDDKEGIRLSALFEIPGERGGQLKASDFREADMFVQGVGKFLQYAPDFLEKSYCIWLGIPDYQEDWAIGVMNQSVELGGLTDDDGFEIIEIFIDQNWESLEAFFQKKIASLRDRVNQYRETEEPKEEKKQLDA